MRPHKRKGQSHLYCHHYDLFILASAKMIELSKIGVYTAVIRWYRLRKRDDEVMGQGVTQNLFNNLSVTTQTLWAKKSTVDGRQRWLPLVTHLRDAELTINQLYNNWLSQSQRRLLCDGFTEEQTQGLVKFVGFVHDIGKATAVFQRKPSYDGNESLDKELIEHLVLYRL